MPVSSQLHPDAQQVARHVCANSTDAVPTGEYIETSESQSALGLSSDAMAMAVDELLEKGYLTALRRLGDGGAKTVAPTPALFLAFDPKLIIDAEDDRPAVCVSKRNDALGDLFGVG